MSAVRKHYKKLLPSNSVHMCRRSVGQVKEVEEVEEVEEDLDLDRAAVLTDFLLRRRFRLRTIAMKSFRGELLYSPV